MKSIILCGSISKSDDIIETKNKLEKMGFEVEIPWGTKKYMHGDSIPVSDEEGAKEKKENDLIRAYYEKIKNYDAVLVVNTEQKGVQGYVGGNTFLEMGFGHVLNKPLFVLHRVPDNLVYSEEIEAMSPIVLDGDLTKIK